jgi:hypothetical protein
VLVVLPVLGLLAELNRDDAASTLALAKAALHRAEEEP